MTWQQKISILSLRGISWIFPRFAAGMAIKLFLTSSRIPRPSSEMEYYNSAKKYRLPSGLAAYEWGSETGPLVLLIHGWNGRGTQMGAFAAPLVEHGYRVVAIDGPAHGESEGTMTNIGEFSNFLVDAEKFLGRAKAVIAHSMGAGVSTVAARKGLNVEKLALIAGPARYEVVVSHFFKAVRVSPSAQKHFIKILTRKAGLSPKQLNIGEMLHELRLPTLVVHDTDDKEVHFQAALDLKAAAPDIQIVQTSGLGHRRVLKDPKIREQILRFIRE